MKEKENIDETINILGTMLRYAYENYALVDMDSRPFDRDMFLNVASDAIQEAKNKLYELFDSYNNENTNKEV